MIHNAIFFDGKTSKAYNARFQFHDRDLEIQAKGELIKFGRSEYEISAEIEESRCCIQCIDGARLEIDDPDACSAVMERLGSRERTVRALTNRISFVLGALLLSIALIYFFMADGIPLIAGAVSKIFPEKTESEIGRQISDRFLRDGRLFQPSLIPSARQATLGNRLSSLCSQEPPCPPYRLHFKNSPIFKANAFALPGGDIVITDSLINVASSDEEVIAVLAHELGHLEHRHSLRRMLESSLSAIVLVGITGDVDTIASALPSLMFDLKYSRGLEEEADRFALQFLSRHCISPSAFVNILDRMEKNNVDQDDKSYARSLMSTHPGSEERVRLFKQELSKECH